MLLYLRRMSQSTVLRPRKSILQHHLLGPSCPIRRLFIFGWQLAIREIEKEKKVEDDIDECARLVLKLLRHGTRKECPLEHMLLGPSVCLTLILNLFV